MSFNHTVRLATIGMLSLFALSTAQTASAKSNSLTTWKKVYKVQVEYWFWDSETYYWSDYYETENQGAAQFVFDYLENAKNAGTLNQAAPNSYWKYIAVDVRLIVQWKAVHHPIDLSYEQHPRPTINVGDYWDRD